MGKTVLLEWGWIYNGSSLLDLPTFFDENGIRRTYENYIEEILSREGDMDMMTGVIKTLSILLERIHLIVQRSYKV